MCVHAKAQVQQGGVSQAGESMQVHKMRCVIQGASLDCVRNTIYFLVSYQRHSCKCVEDSKPPRRNSSEPPIPLKITHISSQTQPTHTDPNPPSYSSSQKSSNSKQATCTSRAQPKSHQPTGHSTSQRRQLV